VYEGYSKGGTGAEGGGHIKDTKKERMKKIKRKGKARKKKEKRKIGKKFLFP